MNVWIVNPYGTLPSEGWREYRSSMLARALEERGHEVTWFISNFEHRSKIFRPEGILKDEYLSDRINIVSIPSSEYIKNISISRIKYEYLFGKNFAGVANSITRPDVIVLADPSLFYSAPIIRYARKVGAKVVLDVLDLWPEQFQVALPKLLRPLGRMIFSALYRRRQRLVDQVDAVVGVTKDHLSAVNPPQDTPSLVAYLGLNLNKFLVDSQKVIPASIKSFVKDSDLVVVYAGTLGEAYDVSTLLTAVRMVINNNKKIKFIFIGEGPLSDSVRALSECFPDNVIFVGKLLAEDLPSIYKICHVGICSYSKDSTVTMPVKLYDYLAGGLFVIYSIEGEIDEILSGNFCGIKYAAGSPEELSTLIVKLVNSSVMQKSTTSYNIAASFDERLQHGLFAKLIEEI